MIEYTNQIINRLLSWMPHPKVEIDFSNAFQLLIATILSAQSTDVTVNQVTKILFSKYPDPSSLAKADIDDVIGIIKSTGFFNNKAKSIINCSKELVANCEGKVPSNLEELVKLPGVGRKTANVVLGAVYGIPGIVVDTHMSRVSLRLGLSEQKSAEKIEQDLMKKVEKTNWIHFSILMVLHGRYTCKARKPECNQCVLLDICPWEDKVNFN
jgi:endonuclease III